jgi:hypothetical protein
MPRCSLKTKSYALSAALPVLLALTAASTASTASAQSAFGLEEGGAVTQDNGSFGVNEADLDSDSAIEGATPTDNVNELNPAADADSPAVNNFPAEEDGEFIDTGAPAKNGPVDAGSDVPEADEAGDELFGDGAQAEEPPVNAAAPAAQPAAAAAPTAQQTAAPATPAPAAVNPPAQFLAAPPGPAAPVAAPAAVPIPPAAAPAGNAAALMNQIEQGANLATPAVQPAPPPAQVAPPPPPQPVAPTATRPSGPITPVIATEAEPVPLAPTLPPPNEFAGAPTVPGTLQQVAEGEAPEDYVVQPGDTLFDICDQLLDEGGYWPKLWSMNPEIKNPHFIFPQMKLRFYPGDDETPPYLQVVSEDDVMPIDKGDLDEKDLIKEPIQLQIATDSDQLPEEEPIAIVGPEELSGEDLQTPYVYGGKVYTGQELRLQVPGFIFNEEREELAVVLGGRDGETNIGAGHKALVESTNGVSAGTIYTVLRPGKKIDNPETGDFVGYQYYFVANVRIEKPLGDDVYVGAIQDMRLPLMPDDILVNYVSTYRTIPANDAVGALSSTKANIVGFQFGDQSVGGAGQFAFIDKGSGAGVSPGMFLQVFSTPGYLTPAFGDTDLPVDYRPVGVIRIIDATDAGAVGYIVRNTNEVRLGDRAGRG